ncbi:NAD(P)-binding protein [Caballeronia sp. LjRoot29]|uniref:NAD(P)-binding protein n=1 Tax=Caballeronia sp. LjRoot29 TaxID=3342315 RepID=UPI003F503552
MNGQCSAPSHSGVQLSPLTFKPLLFANGTPYREPMNHYDVIVLGSGPGGASLAHKLASTGKSILLLERGDYRKRSVKDTPRAGIDYGEASLSALPRFQGNKAS